MPVHGERRHILEHVKLASELQVPEAIAPKNGDLIRLAPGPAALIDEVPSGRLYVDGASMVEADDEALRDRQRLGAEGAVNVRLWSANKKSAIIAGPNVSVRGLAMKDEEDMDLALEEMERAAEAAFGKLGHGERGRGRGGRGRDHARGAQGGRAALGQAAAGGRERVAGLGCADLRSLHE